MLASNRPSRPPVVLIASDQEWSSRSLESVLGPRGYAVLRAGTGQRTLELARIAQPDGCILDAGMADIRGVELCARLRQDTKFPLNVPIIMTTSSIGNRAERLEAYAAGAWELCAEPLDIDVLLLKLDAFVQAKLAADRVRDETLVDEETGLYNMRGLARRAREIGGDATRRRDAIACVVFAPEPDGRTGGDGTADSEVPAVAETVSRVCRSNARISDAVGRLGPNEYAIIAPSTSAAGADTIVERLRHSFAAATVKVGGRDHHLRFTAFVAAVPNLAESSADALELLYSATASLRQARSYGSAIEGASVGGPSPSSR
jgi:diguanylate cyclase (GGDEF)-like protein